MLKQKIASYWEQLQTENNRSFYLAFLRVAISLWLLKELLIDLPNLEMLYSTSSFAVMKEITLNGRFHITTAPFRQHYLLLNAVYFALIVFNLFGIGRWFTGCALYCVLTIIHNLDKVILNGGDQLAARMVFFLALANTYEYFTLYKRKQPLDEDDKRLSNLLSNLCAFSIMLQLCVAYFMTGIAKLHSDVWHNGTASYYALLMERYMGTPLNKYLVQHGWFVISTTYFTLAFELLFAFLIWIKKLRVPLIIMGILLHASIYVFLMIYGFQIVFVLNYGMFFTDKEWYSFLKKIKLFNRMEHG